MIDGSGRVRDPGPMRLATASANTYRRFVSLPDGGAEALALWIVVTYTLEAFDVAPTVPWARNPDCFPPGARA